MANSLIGDFFNNFDRIKEMKPNKPVLIIHGESDDVIPYQHSLELYEEIQKKVFSQNINNKCLI